MVALCLLYDAYRPELPAWWKQHGGGVPYVMFFVALFAVCVPSAKWRSFVVAVPTLGTVALEFLQMVKVEPLTTLRSHRLGQALLGSGFDWHDIPPYFIGGVLGGLMLWWAMPSEERRLGAELV